MTMKHWMLGAAVAVALAMPAAVAPGSALDEVMLTGTIKSDTGAPMEGVTVSARLPGQTFTTSVFTDADGQYFFPRMKDGKYKVWAQAVGFTDGITEVDLNANPAKRVSLDSRTGGPIVHQDFTLKTRDNYELQMRGDEWVASMPTATVQDKKMKEVFRNACMGCHPPSVALKDRFDAKGWHNIIKVMSRIVTNGYGVGADTQPNPLMEYYNADLADWLAKIRGPGPSTMALKPRPRPTGDATLTVIREYDVPQPGTGLPLFNDGSLWSEGAPSKLDFKNHHAIDGTLDFDGNVWFSDDVNSNTYRTAGKIDWKTGEVTNIKVPKSDGSGLAANTHDIITDHDGMIWFAAEGENKLFKVDPRSLKMESFPAPPGSDFGAFLAVDGKNGIHSPAARFDPVTKRFQVFTKTTEKTMKGSTATYGVAADKNGNAWVTEYAIDTLLFENAATGESEDVAVPRRKNPVWDLFTGDDRKIFEIMGGANHPGRGTPYQYAIRKPSSGPGPTDAVWGPGWFGDGLIKVDLDTRKVTVYPTPSPDVGCYQTVVDEDGMVWVIFTDGDFVGKFDPKTEKWVRYDLPTLGAEAHGLETAPVNGRTQITVPYFAAGKTAKMEFRTKEEQLALKAEVNAAGPR